MSPLDTTFVAVGHSARLRGWHAGPPSQPHDRNGRTPALLALTSIRQAVASTYATDAHVCPLHGEAPAGGKLIPRPAADMLHLYADSLHRTSAWLDFDLSDHKGGRWGEDGLLPADEAQAAIVAYLTEAGLPPHALYMSRGGARAVYVLDQAVPASMWGWFERWVETTWRPLLAKRAWTAIGLKGAASLLETKAPANLFRLANVIRRWEDGRTETLRPPDPHFDDAAPLVTVGPLTEADRYTVTKRSDLGDAPDVPDRIPATDPRWHAAKLALWADLESLPTAATYASVPEGETSFALPERLPSTTGLRSTVIALAARAASVLALRGLTPEEAAAEAYALLAPLAVIPAGDASEDDYPGTADLLWWCLGTFCTHEAGKRARDPDRPLIVSVGAEGGYRILHEGEYLYVPAGKMVSFLRTKHPWTIDQLGDIKPAAHSLAWEAFGGHTAARIQYSYTEATGLDSQESKLIANSARLCDVTPERSQACEEFLCVLIPRPSDRAVLAQFLASFKRLDKPAVVIMLLGAPGSGKGLLGQAIARLFRRKGGFVKFATAMSRFNKSLTRTPFVWLDDGEGVSRGSDVAKFKAMTGTNDHEIEEKFESIGRLDGCVRALVTDNEEDPLQFAKFLQGEAESRNTHDALGQRIHIITVPDSAREWMVRKGDYDHTDTWVDDGTHPGELVRHLAWIMENTALDTNRRFFGQTNASDWIQRLSVTGGVEGEIAQALAEAVEGWNDAIRVPDTMVMAQPRSVVFSDSIALDAGGVWVRPGNLRRVWGAFMGPGRPWKRQTLTQAFRNLHSGSLGGDDKPKKREVKGWGRTRAYFVSVESLAAVAEDEEALRDVLRGAA